MHASIGALLSLLGVIIRQGFTHYNTHTHTHTHTLSRALTFLCKCTHAHTHLRDKPTGN